jgi:DNA-binding transcriptional MerR regulator
MPAIAPVTIAGLAALSGVDVEQIRSYQELRLLPDPLQRPGQAGEVTYHGEHLELLWFIRRAMALGFGISAVADLLSVKREYGTCGDAYAIAQRTLDDIRSSGIQPSPDLSRLIETCPRRGGAKDCPLLTELAQPMPITASPRPTGDELDRPERVDGFGNAASVADTSGSFGDREASPMVGEPGLHARIAKFRAQAKEARSQAYKITSEGARTHWLKVAASWDRLADLEEMSIPDSE